ncbi:hypothetical protein GQ600_10289 [Phytophthora cactorum]|nr:hypothetical protein GQ600_10289 [Phytophthora cactorum]
MDILELRRVAVEELARSNVALSEGAIWYRINDQFYGGAQNHALIGLTREQVLTHVRGRCARGQVRKTIQLPRAVELSTEWDDSSTDEDDTKCRTRTVMLK